ncbi:hypothetical protein SDJN02_13302, partial [Cucurbita argyrosperma subsp. argyrosperma]
MKATYYRPAALKCFHLQLSKLPWLICCVLPLSFYIILFIGVCIVVFAPSRIRPTTNQAENSLRSLKDSSQ